MKSLTKTIVSRVFFHRLAALYVALALTVTVLLTTNTYAQSTRSSTNSPTSTDSLTLATYTYSTNNRLANIAPFGAFLSKELHRPVRVMSFPDPPSLVRGIESGAVDIAVINTFGYLLLAASAFKSGIPVATFRIPHGQTSNYRTVIVARRSTNVTPASLMAQARSLAVTFVSPGSTTGNLVPRLYLASLGMADAEQSFRTVSYAGTHAEALQRLRSGEAGIAALASEEYEKTVQREPELAKTLAVVWTSENIKLGPIVINRALPAILREAISSSIVGAERTAPLAFAALRDGWVEAKLADALVPATDQYYDDVRAMFGNPNTAAALITRFAR